MAKKKSSPLRMKGESPAAFTGRTMANGGLRMKGESPAAFTGKTMGLKSKGGALSSLALKGTPVRRRGNARGK